MINNNQLTKSEMDGLLRILRGNVKTAKASVVSRAAELKAAFEIQLDTLYPPEGDAVWNEAYEQAILACEPFIRRISERCDELNLGTRFRPSLSPPRWSYGGEQVFKQLRDNRRKVAHVQIDAKIKSDIEELEKKSNAVMLEIISTGLVTDTAKDFLSKLPTVDSLVPPTRVEELAAFIEGKALPNKTLTSQLRQLNGYQPPQLDDE
jgi:hypothetical protein